MLPGEDDEHPDFAGHCGSRHRAWAWPVEYVEGRLAQPCATIDALARAASVWGRGADHGCGLVAWRVRPAQDMTPRAG